MVTRQRLLSPPAILIVVHQLFIGTAPEEWWEGHDEIARVVRAQAEALGRGEIVGSNPAIHEMGDVGWTADRVTMRLADGTEVPLRLTTTWCREDGVWKMVQGHTSVGIGNADAFNKDVTL